MNKDILIVDDEADIRALIRAILEDEGYQVREAENSQTALKHIEERTPDLAILDIWLQESDDDGIEILKHIKAGHPLTPVLMISGHGTIETAVNAIKLGAYDFIEKPFKSDRLLLMIERALEISELKKENKTLKERNIKKSESLIGNSSAMQHVKQQIEKVAPTNSRVLIEGEAGTGKEVVAKIIHQQSERQNEPFFTLNCATLNPARLEEELFGLMSGSEAQKGVLELAHGGTVFLDEISDMPIETQGKILRILQDSIVTPVGSHKENKIDVRFLASTNKDLKELIEQKDFREDLYYRLNVVTINVPPLKKRVNDIRDLSDFFLSSFAEQTGQPKRRLSSEAISNLELYEWPGNVRQLKNMMEWLTIMAPKPDKKKVLGITDLPPEFSGSQGKNRQKTDNFNFLGQSLREAREEFEKTYLKAQIKRFNGNISKTAQFIGMERSALHRKLKSLDISINEAQNGESNIKKLPLTA